MTFIRNDVAFVPDGQMDGRGDALAAILYISFANVHDNTSKQENNEC